MATMEYDKQITSQRFGEVKGCPVYLMDTATKSLAPSGYVCIQSLLTGETTTVKESMVQNITTTYPLIRI